MPLGGDVGARLLIPSTMGHKSQAEITAGGAMGVESAQAAVDALRNPPPTNEPRKAKSEIVVPSEQRRGDRETLLHPVVDSYRRDLKAYFAAQSAALGPATSGKAIPSDEGASIIERAIAILTGKRWRDRLARISEAPISASITMGAAEAAGTMGVAVSFSIPASEPALALLTGHLDRLGVGIQNTSVAAVRKVLEDGLRAGLSRTELRASLASLFDGYEDWRVDRIARTETTAAYNLGSIGQYREAGVKLVTVVDGDGDENCAPWNGREHVPLEEAEGAPLGHPNCTRTWIPETEGLFERELATEPEARKGAMRVEFDIPAPIVNVPAPVVNIPAPLVNVAPPIVNVAAGKAPVVNVDTKPFTDAVAGLRSDMAAVKAEIRKPRQRKLVRDDIGRVTGSEDVVE